MSSICISYPLFDASCQSLVGSLAFRAGNRSKTPELSARPKGRGIFVVGLNDSQSTLRTKFRNTSRVYQSRPKPFGLASRIEPNSVRKSPPPDICQPWRDPVNSGLNAGLAGSVRLATMASAVRRASVVEVRDGLADPMTGNNAGPETKAFAR